MAIVNTSGLAELSVVRLPEVSCMDLWEPCIASLELVEEARSQNRLPSLTACTQKWALSLGISRLSGGLDTVEACFLMGTASCIHSDKTNHLLPLIYHHIIANPSIWLALKDTMNGIIVSYLFDTLGQRSIRSTTVKYENVGVLFVFDLEEAIQYWKEQGKVSESESIRP